MAADNISKLRLYEDTFSEDTMTDENSLANAMLTQPDIISPVLTHLVGREDQRFPLSFLTEGIGRIEKKSINDIEYDYPVMGRINKAVAIADNSISTSQGVGHAPFEIPFEERWFVKQYIIESPDDTQVRIMKDPEYKNGYWWYTVQTVNPSANASVAADQLTPGTLWAQLGAPVAASGSRGNESHFVAPSKMRNQITHVRKSYGYEGNIMNKVVNVEFKVNGSPTKLWWDFEEWQHSLRWMEECESMWWYSQYNRNENGDIPLLDENGKPVPIGSGVLEQIPNYDTYSVLTASKLKSVVRDALYGASDAQKMNIVLFTGTGGMEEFDNAMKDELASRTYIKLDAGKFVTGTGASLELGGFFTSYQHVDGHTITVRKLPILDHGMRALKSRKHPVTGLPLESYRMIFLDMSTYDGQANITHVTQNGREMLRWAVAGATVPKGFSGNALRATDIDGATIHFMKTGGICIRRATNCMHLACIAS